MKILRKEEYLLNLELTGESFISYEYLYKLKEHEFYKSLENLIKEHFELVEKYNKQSKVLDNAIKQCCINVTGSDACNSLDDLYEAFREKVWKDV